MDQLDGQVFLVTGATDGLGRALAERAAADGATVIVHGRSREKCENAVNEISKATGNERLHFHVADFASLARVRDLAAEILDTYDRLDVLVNNAGIGVGGSGDGGRRLSEDGYELRFAVNYLAHYLLTHRLLALLRASAPARVVNVASGAQQAIDFDDVMLERGYSGMRAYSQSKLAQVMFTFDVAEQLRGDDVTVNALHPASLMDTKIVREGFGQPMASVDEGLAATYRLAAEPGLAGVSGRYFSGSRESRAHEQAYDPAARERLREVAERASSRG